MDSYKVIVNYIEVPCGMLPKMYENAVPVTLAPVKTVLQTGQ